MTARRSPRGSGRAARWFAIGLLAFVGTAVIVIWRRSRGAAEEARIVQLDRERRDLEAQRISLQRELRQAMSAERISAAAQRRLGLRAPSDSQIVTLLRSREDATLADPDPTDRP